MPIATAFCHVNGTTVSRVVDLEGEVTKVICPEYVEPTGICRLRSEALKGGPLARLLERVEEDTLAERGARCALQ
jgi:hypothetical protein